VAELLFILDVMVSGQDSIVDKNDQGNVFTRVSVITCLKDARERGRRTVARDDLRTGGMGDFETSLSKISSIASERDVP
jgi:hypothetical protein